jgi:hypothetical protein
MNGAKKAILAVSALGLLAGAPTRGESIVLTFQGLQQGEQVANFYNGGFATFEGHTGSGPGPAFGATFGPTNPGSTADAFVLTDMKHYSAEPTPPEVMLLGDTSVPGGQQTAAAMNVAGGFTSDFSFFYGSIESSDAPQSVQIFSGLNGTGALLGSMALMMTPGSSPDPTNPQAVFTATPEDIPFSGVAHSVVFTGGNQQIVFDNIQFTPAIPAPTSVVLLAESVLCLLVGLGRKQLLGRSHRSAP